MLRRCAPFAHAKGLMYDQINQRWPIPLSGVKVEPLPGEHIDSVLRRFKKATQKSGILVDLRRSEYFVQPSRRRREKSVKARRRRSA